MEPNLRACAPGAEEDREPQVHVWKQELSNSQEDPLHMRMPQRQPRNSKPCRDGAARQDARTRQGDRGTATPHPLVRRLLGERHGNGQRDNPSA